MPPTATGEVSAEARFRGRCLGSSERRQPSEAPSKVARSRWLVSCCCLAMQRSISMSSTAPGKLSAATSRQGIFASQRQSAEKLSKMPDAPGPGGPARRRGVLGLGDGARGERVERNSRDVPWDGAVPSYFVPSNMPHFDFSQDLTMRARYVHFWMMIPLGPADLCSAPSQTFARRRRRHACAWPDCVRSAPRDD